MRNFHPWEIINYRLLLIQIVANSNFLQCRLVFYSSMGYSMFRKSFIMIVHSIKHCEPMNGQDKLATSESCPWSKFVVIKWYKIKDPKPLTWESEKKKRITGNIDQKFNCYSISKLEFIGNRKFIDKNKIEPRIYFCEAFWCRFLCRTKSCVCWTSECRRIYCIIYAFGTYIVCYGNASS